ncbi:maleylacetoacetate isomerase-like [Paramacrobiotus metropolitanus]|uniref:maleylacetoacetate isomerase-like n=1 Tax=Paramacrobiotus metropolitanus TaxID=2943436 RepID=UPI00244625D8|nr:maleylacetoacetate isomerase-like [Paramacrobiotus metropolitanus]
MNSSMRLFHPIVRGMASHTGSRKPVLYGYAKSSASWRVRAAFVYKGIEYEQKIFDPYSATQADAEEYKLKLNALRQVPTLFIDGNKMTQSVAILEYIEETRPEKPLLPKDPVKRAKVRQIVEIINSGIQPLQNPPVAQKYSDDAKKQQEWQVYWMERGLGVLEKILVDSSGKYCVGDDITFADLALVPQMFSTRRFGADLNRAPTCKRIFEDLLKLDYFQRTHPNNQPDTPDEERGKNLN